MLKLKPKYITNSEGQKISVILSMKEFNAIIEELEILEDIAIYDKAKKSKGSSIPINEAFSKIESKRAENTILFSE